MISSKVLFLNLSSPRRRLSQNFWILLYENNTAFIFCSNEVLWYLFILNEIRNERRSQRLSQRLTLGLPAIE